MNTNSLKKCWYGIPARQAGAGLVAGMALAMVVFSSPAQSGDPVRERISFNLDWRFIKGDPAGSEGKVSYETLKPWLLAGASEFSPKPVSAPEGQPGEVPCAKSDFDDSGWRRLNLPHDWGIEGPFSQELPGDTGKLPWFGVAWYRKTFEVPVTDGGKQIYLDLDGAMSHAAVWLNGQFVGGWPYGYASWRVNLTPHIKPGAANVLAIRLDNPPESSRWYPGGGIYRNVWLVKTSPIHVSQWGTFVSTPQVSSAAAMASIRVKVDNKSTTPAELAAVTRIHELSTTGKPAGRPVAVSEPASLTVAAGGSAEITQAAMIRKPRLWSIGQPDRYVAVTTLEQNGAVIDRYETPFGVRTILFSARDGFVLNGARVALNGVCNHHDLGALGAAINPRAIERQLELLKEMGCNAIRTSHNPPTPELLDLCDRMGFVVMDEAFDSWAKAKTKNDYHLLFPDWHDEDLRAFVRRDRNHPCVVLWSIGNEVPEQGTTGGKELAGALAAIVRAEDPTRPVTSGCNHTEAGYNGFQQALDVFGFNYKPREYGKFRKANPDMPVMSSESASTVSSRGEYFFPVSTDKAHGRADFHVSSYDLYAPPWAMAPEIEFRAQDEFPFVAGEFVWTGFDYLGEPTPYNADATTLLNFTDPAEKERMAEQLKQLGKLQVPSRSSYFGIFDLAGFKKDRFYIYQARWRPQTRMAHILPHWSWPEREGKVTPIHVYTSGDEAELFVNGLSVGRKKRGPLDYRLTWDDVVYHPGEVRVVAYKNRNRWASDSVQTAGAAAAISMQADRSTVQADGTDLSFVTVRLVDGAGRLSPRADNRVAFEISGPGEIVAIDNGDPTNLQSFQDKDRKAFNGLVLVIVRSTGEAGAITLNAASAGLDSASLRIRTVVPK